MKQSKGRDRTNVILALVVVAMAIVVGFGMLDNPEVVRSVLRVPEQPQPNMRLDRPSGRGQPIVIPTDRGLREEEIRGMDWMEMPALPPLPPDVSVMPTPDVELPGAEEEEGAAEELPAEML
ncbi:MAG: hypothetical protein ACE5R4_05015 [Armatimonadota bacterium]